MRIEGRYRAFLLAALMSAMGATSALAQGSITGRITGRDNGQPVGDARVLVVGSALATSTNADGRYTLRNVPAGAHTVRVIRLGFEEAKQTVTVGAGEVTANFVLVTAVVKLPDVVTTATGEERRIEVGNAIAHIDAATRVKETPIHNMGDLLVAKAPGLSVLTGNMAGAGHQIRIRGLNSVSRSNAPIFVVDGVRVDAGSGGIGVGGTNSSRLNDFTPEEIENIEVIRGPSAATLYGTDAANGVIVITTKKGRAGRSQWQWSSEYGRIEDNNNYPKTYAIWGHTPAAPNVQVRCFNATLATGACIQDSVTSAYMLRDADVTPIGTGNRQMHTAQVSGGTEAVRYFVSGTLEGETGPIRLPVADRRYLDSTNVSIRNEWANPERFDRGSFRANLNAVVNPTFDLSVQTMFMRSEQRLPQVDNNVNSFYYNALTNPGFRHAGLGYSGIGNLGQPLYGWAQFTPGDIFQRTTTEGIKRLVGSSTASWRPLTWLQNDATVGIDFTAARNFALCRLAECPNFGTQRLGSVSDNHGNQRILTATARSTANWQVREWANLRTTVGGDYINNQFDGSNASSTQLPPGAQSVGSGAVKNASNQSPAATKTLGYYIQEQLALRDRLWITGALRTDQNTAFGTKYKGVWYPKLQVSWAASEEPFYPSFLESLNSLRLRMAYGSSGVQPGATSALKTFAPTTVSLFSDQAALLASAIGNPELKPELTTELEAGFDIEALSNRMRVEVTYYNKQTKDALISEEIASSSGASAGSILRNIGSVRNRGFEASMTLQVVDRENLGWDLTVGGAYNDNKVLSLGTLATGAPRVIGTTTRNQAGFPINSYFLVPYTWEDTDGNKLIAPSEVNVMASDTVFMGPAFPPTQATVTTGLDLLQRRVRIHASLDYKGGHTVLNNTQGFLCQQTPTCYAKSDPTAPLWDQARVVASNFTTVRTQFGYYEDASFWRFRELAATVELPPRLVSALRVAGANLNVGARNLKVWTDYTGVDPEENYNQGDTQSTLLTTAPRRYYTVRLNVTF